MRNPESIRLDLFEGTKFASKKKEDVKRSSRHVRAERGFRELRKIADMAGRKREIEERRLG